MRPNIGPHSRSSLSHGGYPVCGPNRQPLRTVPQFPKETLKGIEWECPDKNFRTWIELRKFVSNRHLIQEFGLGRMQRFTVVPLSWHKPFLTLAVSKPLLPQDKSFISQGLHSRGTILSEVLSDEPLIKEWICSGFPAMRLGVCSPPLTFFVQEVGVLLTVGQKKSLVDLYGWLGPPPEFRNLGLKQ